MKFFSKMIVLAALLLAGGHVTAQKNHEYVDLGLPSGTLWATCNVGATQPEDYGDYFAWGETKPKDIYNWNTYQYSNGGFYDRWDFLSHLTKYCDESGYGYKGFTDTLTVLQPSDDAATANWGSGWCMPTKAQWRELYQNTSCTWTTQNGVYGRLFTASNGLSLFLPAAGFRWEDKLNEAGSYGRGHYWSTSLAGDNVAWSFLFEYGNGGYNGMNSDPRRLGYSVRPVRSAPQN